MLGERPAVPRISDLGHLYSSSLGKLELDMMSSHQMTERQVLDAIVAEAIRDVFEEYVERHGLDEIAEIFSRGVKIEVGDLLAVEPVRRAAEAGAAGLGEGLRGERLQRPGGAGLVRRVRAGRAVRQRPISRVRSSTDEQSRIVYEMIAATDTAESTLCRQPS